jgi:hypothetical protein
MAITGNSSYIPTTNQFLGHWRLCNDALAPQSLVVQRADNTTVTREQFSALRDSLQAQQFAIQDCLTNQIIDRSSIRMHKAKLLAQLNQFNGVLDAFYRFTDFHKARPYAPSITDGQEVFSRPLGDAVSLWAKLNASPAPAGITLPLVLGDGTTQAAFVDAVAALQAAYTLERITAQDATLARAARDRMQKEVYGLMKAYRDTVQALMTAHPTLIETLPRLTPLPGHTPEPVTASATFEAPNSSKVVYETSTDALLERYELRGNVGDHYDNDDAIVIATNQPGDPREFVTNFGLTQPGAQIALKVYVVLTTGNEAGSAALLVDRPASVQLLAA